MNAPRTPSTTTKQGGAQPASVDHLELQAAEVARRNGRSVPTDEDRQVAYEDMKKRGQPAPDDEPAPH